MLFSSSQGATPGSKLLRVPPAGELGAQNAFFRGAAAKLQRRALLRAVGAALGGSEPGCPHLSPGSAATAPRAPAAAAGLSLVPRRGGVAVSGATGSGAAAGGGGGGRPGETGSERLCSPARPGSGRRTLREELALGSPGSDSGAGSRCVNLPEARRSPAAL